MDRGPGRAAGSARGRRFRRDPWTPGGGPVSPSDPGEPRAGFDPGRRDPRLPAAGGGEGGSSPEPRPGRERWRRALPPQEAAVLVLVRRQRCSVSIRGLNLQALLTAYLLMIAETMIYEKPPPGFIKEDETKPEDCIPDVPGNEHAREFLAHAPTKGLWMPLGKEVKVMQCWRCKRYGHRTGDKECPFFIKGNQKLEQFRVAHEDPMYDIIRENKRHEKDIRIQQLKQLLEDSTSDDDGSSSSSSEDKEKHKKKKKKEKHKKKKKEKKKKKKRKHKSSKSNESSDSE
nr:PREDICTED: retinitis pigmentosa 9 protein [Bos mutus]